MRPLAVGVALASVLFFCDGAAEAQKKGAPPVAPAAPPSRADTLFDEGTKLFEAGKFAEACEKLDESQRLDPAVGTQFNLAECWQKLGRLLKARAAFEDVVRIAHSSGKADLEQRAKERLTKLETDIPRVIVTASAPPPDTMSIDGVTHPASELAAGIPVDPGEHDVEASAQGKTPHHAKVTSAIGTRTVVQIPVLADVPSAAPIVAAPPEDRKEGRTQRTIAVVSLGVGAAGLLVGGIFGLISLSDHNKAGELCQVATRCESEAGVDAWRDARSAGNVSTIAFIVGGVGVAAGAVLWFTAPKPAAPQVGLNGRGPVVRFDW